ncbi:hypothetical protein BKA65DRAFT_490051 [Rhexocercosporidium sp. MPI-PUGE-AT-0058]|nr:hypothetical protein BKA65DRAFT_490051 [Rhexocercosporidium sp. MPI-PUGE-AT-0058]
MKDKGQLRGAHRTPPEIWNQVRTYLPIFSRYTLDSVLGGSENQHLRIWHSIFKNEDFLDEATNKGLNPVLIGHDLNKLYHSKYNKSKPGTSYLVLVLAFDGAGGKYEKPALLHPMALKKSLQPHELLEDNLTEEYFFPESRIILNVADIHNAHYTPVDQPRRLTSRKIQGLYSAYLYWNDPEFELRIIEPENVKGVGKALTKKNVSGIVALSWFHLPSKKLRQHVFAYPGMALQTDQINNGERGSSFKITGWKWKKP